jgi:hypothetical protein
MRSISLLEALDLIGHDRKDELRRALRAGDVKARIRHEDGSTEDLPLSFWSDDDIVKIDWENGWLVSRRRPGVLSLLPEPIVINVEVDRVTLLEAFSCQPRAVSAREVHPRKKEPPGLEGWYIARTRQVAHSNRNEDLHAARKHFGYGWAKDRERLRELRRHHAPDNWKKPGPKNRA